MTFFWGWSLLDSSTNGGTTYEEELGSRSPWTRDSKRRNESGMHVRNKNKNVGIGKGVLWQQVVREHPANQSAGATAHQSLSNFSDCNWRD